MMNLKQQASNSTLRKVHTGIEGFDEITEGGLPYGRPTLVCGDAGCGKTLFSMEFLVRGAVQYNEPGVFMSFEETETELTTNVASLGFDLEDLVKRKKIFLDHVQIERSEIEETGEYDLQALFIRLDHAIKKVKAKRLVLDTIESLFSGLPNPAILRAELRRLFRWLKDKKVTVIITGERGDGGYTRQGMEEYVSDCVIMLDHRIIEQVSTRRLRVVKYRGSVHGTNEYPFLIDKNGISVFPITSLTLDHNVSEERISSGITELDSMLEGKGFFRGSTVLISGSTGTGKTSMAAQMTHASCQRGERVLYFAYEESPKQIMRNMRSIGIHLEQWVKKGLLKFHATRPTFYGLEMHLAAILKDINDYDPKVVIVDPLNSFTTPFNELETKSLSVKLIDFLKSRQITGFFTVLSTVELPEQTTIYISSLIDTWLILRDIEVNGERTRGLHILKSRGMAHSNRVRKYLITGNGILFNKDYIDQEYVSTRQQKPKGSSPGKVKVNK
ncbi:MAG TPA: circadian clock protein KaiC [Bacteroidales bacterium]|jgi:circadian clock protein KaiC|nr:circadian clock protein KaiC [Bacteroidales bacterium]